MIKPFGLILIGYIIKKIFLNKTLDFKKMFNEFISLTIILELFINVGYMIRIGEYEFLYNEFFLVILLIISIIIIVRDRKSIKIYYSMIIYTTSLIITELLLAMNPINDLIYRNGLYIKPQFSYYSIMILSRIIIILIVSIIVVNYLKKEDINFIINKVINYTKYIYFICILEWILKNIFKSNLYNMLVNFLFGKGAYSVDFLLERGSAYTIQGLLREPAHLSFGLFIFLLILIFSNLNIREKNKYLFIGLAILIISGSLSSVAYIIGIILIYIIYRNVNKVKIILKYSILSIIVLCIIPRETVSYFFNRIVNSINIINLSDQIVSNTSEQVRLSSIIETYNTVFKLRPLFGAGLGIPYAYSTNIMILSSIGLVGFIMWFWYYFISIGRIKSNHIIIIFIIFIILNFIGSISILYSSFTLILVMQFRFSREQIYTE